MVADFFKLVAVAIGLLLLVAVEALDWVGRMDLIQTRWPGGWKFLNNRPARLLLLVIAIAFLARDFGDTVAVSGPPVVVSPRQPALIPPPQFIEPADSLRRRTVSLANEIEAFRNERRDGHPPYGNSLSTATGEQATRNEKSDRYDAETERLCLSRFEDRTRGIVQELKAKGVDLGSGLDSGYFEAMIEQRRCIDERQCKLLRDLAYHLDGADKLVTF